MVSEQTLADDMTFGVKENIYWSLVYTRKFSIVRLACLY